MGPSRPSRAYLGMVCLGYSVRSMTASRQWRWVPPTGCGAASLGLAMSCVFVLQATCQCTRSNGVGEFKVMVAHVGWWRSWVVVLCCARVLCGQRSGEIHVGLSDPDVVPLPVAPFPPGGIEGILCPYSTRSWTMVQATILCRRCFSHEGAARDSTFWCTWSVVEKFGGHSDCGSSSSSQFALVFISLLLDMFVLLPKYYLWFELVYRCDCNINIAEQKPNSRCRIQAIPNWEMIPIT